MLAPGVVEPGGDAAGGCSAGALGSQVSWGKRDLKSWNRCFFWTGCFIFLKSALLSPHRFVFLWEIVFPSSTSEVVQCFPVLEIVSCFEAISFLLQ